VTSHQQSGGTAWPGLAELDAEIERVQEMHPDLFEVEAMVDEPRQVPTQSASAWSIDLTGIGGPISILERAVRETSAGTEDRRRCFCGARSVGRHQVDIFVTWGCESHLRLARAAI
jgi:hypothetical protein